MNNIDNPLSEYQPPSKEALRNFGIDISRETVEKYALEKFGRLPQSRIEMKAEQLKAVLHVASKQVPSGIYAISKKGIAILLKETYSTNEELKKAVSDYAMKGFKVYYNEHGRSN